MADAASTPQPFDGQPCVDPLDLCESLSNTSDYPIDAFAFVQEGLRYTVETLERHEEFFESPSRHVSGRELCIGLRDFALDQYGMLARTVLDRWGIHKTEDFGEIVFAMVDAGLMRASDDDSAADFHCVYRFDEAFDGDSVGVG
ncbi:MAG: hypothetical protein H6814_04610 [Phycisphaeraceae bacterium]|nr:hypothetical protein [Phycisphaeraceae bacterium]